MFKNIFFINRGHRMDGIFERIHEQISIIEIHYLSEELKKKIKEELTIICHGEYALISESNYYSFNETLEELVKHRIPESQGNKIGIVGELLLNVIIRLFTNLRIVSPFFNIEGRNIKKGFDIIAVDSLDKIWIIESKAGEVKQEGNITKKVCERIREAKNDLNTRLNKKNSQLWLNAIKSVKSSLDENNEKNTIIKILEKTSNTARSNDKNVVLGGTVFCLFDSKIDDKKILELYRRIKEPNIFSDLIIIAIQKHTYQAVLDYLSELIQE